MQCNECGAEVQGEFQFCPTCGHPIPSQIEPEGPAPTVIDSPSGPDWILGIMSGNDQGGTYPFEDQLVIGREDECDVILNDDRVSRRHATIERTGESSFRLVDHESSNGTFVNEERIEGTAILLAGTPFRIGSTVMSLVPTFETCARCGQSIAGSTTFCGNCGHPVGADVEIDLEKMAAEIEQVASQGKRPSEKPAAEVGTAIPPEVSATTTGSVFSKIKPKLSRRWFGIGCLVLITLIAAAAFCSLAYEFLYDLI